MDLDKDDLAALCAGLTTDEVDRIHRLLHEWSVGPDSSFPVQLALLTRAQWRILPQPADAGTVEIRVALRLGRTFCRLRQSVEQNGMTPAMKNEIVAAKRSKTSSHRFYDGKAEEFVGVFG